MRAAGTFAVNAFVPTGLKPLHDRDGAFSFVHSATASGSDRTAEFFTIVPSSGIGGLAGISGAGGMAVDADGTHRIRFDCRLG
ncbi:DUF3224 domain-containing protein [Streptomyces sp. NPDC056491]|uniref:DUF3224 domain-containing protein n=1 Tax=Streptomyces sp. NPDC056491 TaxID=3345837 RepID=UPI00368B028D